MPTNFIFSKLCATKTEHEQILFILFISKNGKSVCSVLHEFLTWDLMNRLTKQRAYNTVERKKTYSKLFFFCRFTEKVLVVGKGSRRNSELDSLFVLQKCEIKTHLASKKTSVDFFLHFSRIFNG